MPRRASNKPAESPSKSTPILSLPDAWIEALTPAVRIAGLALACALASGLAYWFGPPL